MVYFIILFKALHKRFLGFAPTLLEAAFDNTKENVLDSSAILTINISQMKRTTPTGEADVSSKKFGVGKVEVVIAPKVYFTVFNKLFIRE